MTNPLVSICCICYNHSLYINDCLDGFLIQKTSFDFEILIHDDASTDNTAQIIQEYEEKYPKLVKAIYQSENQYSKGVRPINKFNFERAKGKYIAMCEGDDYWTDPLKLQKQVDFLEDNSDFVMSIHNATFVNLFNGTNYAFNKNMRKEQTIYVKDVLLKSWFTPTASFLFRNNPIIVSELEKWNGVNGDMVILFVNATLGKIYYSDEIMSVYNSGTPSSLALTRINKPKLMFDKKMRLYSHFDRFTSYNYLAYTLVARTKLVLGLFLRKMRLK